MHKLNKGCKSIIIKAVTAFYTALLGVKVMHNRCWLHYDLKLTNIGLINKLLCFILLDVSTFKYI